ncbi:MAG TPA: SRPBCC domain-containing protein [Alphaproteobacteria bacterium]
MSPLNCLEKPERELVITRLLEARPERVFKAWTDPTQLRQWWGPNGFTAPVCEIEARPGGRLRIVMRAPDGAEYPMTGIVREIAAPGRLVFTNIPVDEKGDALLDGLTAVTFGDAGARTKLTVESRAVGIGRVAHVARMLDGMDAGWAQTIDRLAAYVAGR